MARNQHIGECLQAGKYVIGDDLVGEITEEQVAFNFIHFNGLVANFARFEALDHGLGIYTGYYHMSSVAVTRGEVVQPGRLLGEVGTTGLSTGNHLHWDLLVNATWVDAAAWLEQDTACWVLAGLGQSCEEIGD